MRLRHLKHTSIFLVSALVLSISSFNASAIGHYDAMKDRYAIYKLDLKCLDNYVLLHFFEKEPYFVFTDLRLFTNTPIQNTYDRLGEKLTGDETPEEVYEFFEDIVLSEALTLNYDAKQLELFISYIPNILKELGVDVDALNASVNKISILEEVAKNKYDSMEAFAESLKKASGNILPEEGFEDLDEVEWAEEAIKHFADKGIISGINDLEFAPDQSIKREELAKILSLAFELTNAANISFDDVSEDDWYYDFVRKVVDADLMTGYGEEFGVGDELIRQDLAVICARYLKSKNKLPAVNQETDSFIDVDDISDYAKESVKILSDMGIVNGMEDGSFRPNSPVSRAQAIKVIYETIIQCKEVK